MSGPNGQSQDGDQFDACFPVLVYDSATEWAKGGDPAADLEAVMQRLDALPKVFPPALGGGVL